VSEQVIKLMASRQVGLACADDIRTEASRPVPLRYASYNPDAGNPDGGANSTGIAPVQRNTLTVPAGQPVKLRLGRNLSSAHIKTDDIIPFEVLEDVVYNHTVLIQRGAPAFGTVTAASPKRTMGRAGKIALQVDYAMLANGDKVALTHREEGDSHGHTGLMIGLMVPTAIVYPPAAPFWLFMHGKDSVIPDGQDFAAVTDSQLNLDRLDFDRR
jgi:hypothetical protein